MVKLSIFLMVCLCSIQLTGQQLQLTNPIRFLALGDSYTIGQGVSPSARWPVQLLDSLEERGFVVDTLRIIATTGWRTDNLINAIKNQNLEDQDYNLVSLLIGVNNQYQNRPFSQYITEFPALLDSAIRYAGGDPSKVFVVSIPDYAYTPFGQNQDPAMISMEIDEYNAYNRQVAESYGVTYFDITPISRQGLDIPAYVANDGLHPSGVQYTEWVKLMLEYIDEHITSTDDHNEVRGLALTLSPNPVADVVHVAIHRQELVFPISIEVFGMDGVIVHRSQAYAADLVIPVEQLSAGLYVAKVITGGYIGTRKFVKE